MIVPRARLSALLICFCPALALAPAAPWEAASAAAQEPPWTSIAVQGGWEFEQWLDEACRFGDTLIDAAPDRYGPRPTPLWVGIIDPATGGMVQEKPPNWQTYWDAEDYIMTAQGCNLYRDMPTLRAFCQLSDTTGDKRYQEAAEAYLRFWLRECPSKTTGLFPWGEHLSYNCARDRINATRHEMEHNLPDWELLWDIAPEAVQREIEAIHRIHVYDKDAFLYDRHGNYYTGEFDPLPVRGTYIKHSGLFAYSFMFLYSKTREPEHLEWARKAADLYWRHRDETTGILPGYVSSGGGSENSKTQLLLAYMLLRGLAFYPDPYVRERALGMVDSHLKYGFDTATGELAASLVPATGKVIGKVDPWAHGEYAETYAVMACWEAYALTREQRYLDVVEARLEHLSNTPLEDGIEPGVIGNWIDLSLKAYEATGKKAYLMLARRLAGWSLTTLVREGLILEHSGGCVYRNSGLPGALMKAWLDLYDVETRLSLHWRASASVRPSEGHFVVMAQPGPDAHEIRLDYRWSDGRAGSCPADAQSGAQAFRVAFPANVAQGPVELRFVDASDATPLDEGTILVATNPAGPAIGPWDYPPRVDRTQPLLGRVRVADLSGIVKVLCRYRFPDGKEGQALCAASEDDAGSFAFTIPPAGEKNTGRVTFTVEAWGNPAWPVGSESEEQSVLLASVTPLRFSGKAGEQIAVPVAGAKGGLMATLTPAQDTDGAVVVLERMSDNPVSDATGLPETILSDFLLLREDKALLLDGLALCVPYDNDAAQETLASSLTAYSWQDKRWEAMPDAAKDTDDGTVTFACGKGQYFVIAAKPRLWWRRTFNGALLSSPAVARIDADGRLAVILDTRAPDGALFALDANGKTLWTYDVDAAQPFPTVADVDGDNIDEIAVGGPGLALLGSDGAVRWSKDLADTTSPVIGDLTGDGTPDVAAATKHGEVAAFSAKGDPLWHVTGLGEKFGIPALGDVNGDGALDVIAGGDGVLVALSGTDGTKLWEAALNRESMHAPAVADLDDDGRDEVVSYARTDNKGTLSVFDNDGAVLWSAEVSREPDWCPVVTNFEGTKELQILAQQTSGKELGIYSAEGALLRAIAMPGRLLQTPAPVDLDGDGRLDLLFASDLAYQVRAYGNDGSLLWRYTPHSFTLGGAKIKYGGSLLVADVDGDGYLDMLGGDDETWLNAVETNTPSAPFAVASGQFHGDSRHSGLYLSPVTQ